MVMTIKDFVKEPRTPRAHKKKKTYPIVETSLTTVTTRTATETTRNTSHHASSKRQSSPETTISEQEEHVVAPQPQLSTTSHSRSSNGSHLILLHELIAGRQFEQALERLEMTPDEARLANLSTSNLALHEACQHQAPIEVVEALLEVYGDAISVPGQWGYLPLHLAVCSRADSEVVRKLIESYPAATRHQTNHEGKLPLHLACKWGACSASVLMLTVVHPKAIFVEDLSGKTPLQHAEFVAQTSPSGSSDMSQNANQAMEILTTIAPLLLTVTKAAMVQLAAESDAKFSEAVQNYQQRFVNVKERYEEDKVQAEELEHQLREELQSARKESGLLQQRVEELEGALMGKQQQESQEIDALQQQVMEMQAKLDAKDQELAQSKQLMASIQGLLMGEQKNAPAMEDVKHFAALSPSSKSHSTPRTAHLRHSDKIDNARDSLRDESDTRDSKYYFVHREKQEYHSPHPQNKEKKHQDVVHSAFTPAKSVHRTTSPKKSRSSPKHKSSKNTTKPVEAVKQRKIPTELILEVNRDDSNEQRDDHLAETRDAPPTSPRPDYQFPLDDYERDNKRPYGSKMSEKDKIRAVESVKNWFSSEAEALSNSEDDLLSRLLANSEKSVGRDSKKERRDRISDARSSSPRKSKKDVDVEVPTDIAARSYAIRHGYSKPDDVEPAKTSAGDHYQHYRQEYESLLSRSKSNLRRRMQDSKPAKRDDSEKKSKSTENASDRHTSHGKKKVPSKQKSTRHGSKRRSSQKPLEVIIDRKMMYKGDIGSTENRQKALSSPKRENLHAGHHHNEESRDDLQEYRRSRTPNRRESHDQEEKLAKEREQWNEYDDHDEDSTLVSAME